MTVWRLFLRPGGGVVPVPDRFSWTALVFGPLWFAAHVSVIAASGSVLLLVGAGLLPEPARWIAGLGLAWLMGLFGQDIRALELELRGYQSAGLVMADSGDAARLRGFEHGLLR